jgi:hypothetical protein
MQRWLVIVVAVVAVGAVVAVAVWRRASVWPPKDSSNASTNATFNPDDVAKAIEAVRHGGSSITVNRGGKPTTVFFALEGAQDVSTELNADGESSVVKVTLQREKPVLLTKAAYDRIENGMTYSQVAQIVGGELAKGRLSEGFDGGFVIFQGKREMELVFQSGKVTDKSSKGLE